MGASATLAAETGLVLGYVPTRVLGQYDISLLGGDAPPRLLFVAPNLDKAVHELDVDSLAFGRWVAAHELTHVFQFQGGALAAHSHERPAARVPGHRGGANRQRQRGWHALAARSTQAIETFRDGGLAALVQSEDQRAQMERIQAAMAVIEGYSST